MVGIQLQECIPVGCVLPATVAGGSPPGIPREQAPQDHSPPGPCTLRDHAPLGTMHQPCGQTDACKHITSPQTSLVLLLYSVVTCKAGFYLNNEQCEECPIGFYKQLEGNSNCTSCPENATTEALGAVVEKQCGE